jgi:hypothetical protein
MDFSGKVDCMGKKPHNLCASIVLHAPCRLGVKPARCRALDCIGRRSVGEPLPRGAFFFARASFTTLNARRASEFRRRQKCGLSQKRIVSAVVTIRVVGV